MVEGYSRSVGGWVVTPISKEPAHLSTHRSSRTSNISLGLSNDSRQKNTNQSYLQLIKIKLSIFPVCSLAIGEDACSTHHGGARAHVGHGGREVQEARIVSGDAHLNAA
ncbi:hypothetical protein E2C01_026023 [Portunus trituberculatus]|uniref:Uncharacterized protein n=1 Tax=Portunus trituberculatus TaxID=210409 RepID=A0A5B7EHA5_PORTR|nr:hypothetical protein [Portunus trituberculatus]